MVTDGAYSLPLKLSQIPIVEWQQFMFEGAGAIYAQDAFINVNPDLQKRTIYLHVTSNILRFSQNVYYGQMEFYYRGQMIGAELWRNAAAVLSGDNRPNKNTVTSLNTVFTPMANAIQIGFPTLANLVLTPHHYRNITCDLIRFRILRENATAGTGRIFLGCRSQLSIC